MDSEQSAYVTAQQKHHRYMIFGKKQRYIEVFQCSGEDMNLVLTGGNSNYLTVVTIVISISTLFDQVLLK